MMEKNGRNGGKERLMVERNDSSSSHSSKTVRWPAFIDVTQPEDFGLVGVRKFYLEVEENSRIGVWHIPPADTAASQVDYTQYEQLLDGGRPIFLYLHLTSGTRQINNMQSGKLEVLQSSGTAAVYFVPTKKQATQNPLDHCTLLEQPGSAETGFVPGVGLVFLSKTKSGDYHDEMNSQHFLEWFENKLLPALNDRKCTIVMDNATYHNARVPSSIPPNTSSNKEQIITWLRERNIVHDPKALKVQLLQLVRMYKGKPEYKTDVIAKKHGQEVLRLPIKHCELNPIELIQAEEKNFIGTRNSTFKLKDVRTLYQQAKQSITKDKWKKAVDFVIKNVENVFWEEDGIQLSDVEPVVININDTDNDEESNDDDCHQSEDSDVDSSDETDDDDDDVSEDNSDDDGNDDECSDDNNDDDKHFNVKWNNSYGADMENGTESIDNGEDTITCTICKRVEPPNIKKKQKNVSWGQCDYCDRWVHLEYCCTDKNVDAEDIFKCPNCKIILGNTEM